MLHQTPWSPQRRLSEETLLLLPILLLLLILLVLLHATCEKNAAGSGNCAGILIEHKVDRDAFDLNGDTPLHYAARYGHAQVAEVLLKYHAHHDLANQKLETPLQLCEVANRNAASAGDHSKIIILLRETVSRQRANTNSSQLSIHRLKDLEYRNERSCRPLASASKADDGAGSLYSSEYSKQSTVVAQSLR